MLCGLDDRNGCCIEVILMKLWLKYNLSLKSLKLLYSVESISKCVLIVAADAADTAHVAVDTSLARSVVIHCCEIA